MSHITHLMDLCTMSKAWCSHAVHAALGRTSDSAAFLPLCHAALQCPPLFCKCIGHVVPDVQPPQATPASANGGGTPPGTWEEWRMSLRRMMGRVVLMWRGHSRG